MSGVKNKTEDLGNNESRSIGIFEAQGQFLVLTRSTSRWFKTRRGAENFLKRVFPDLYKELMRG